MLLFNNVTWLLLMDTAGRFVRIIALNRANETDLGAVRGKIHRCVTRGSSVCIDL